MKRREDWPERLLAFIEERREMPFAWGDNDCCTFAADAICEITGADLMADLRGSYDDARTAAVAIAGAGGLEAALDVRLKRVAPLLAQRGDLVMFEAQDGPALGIVMGSHAAGVGPPGVTWVPMEYWMGAWKVGGIV